MSDTKMPFGKHKGLFMDDVPASYLMWLWENDVQHFGVRKYIEENLDGLKKNIADGLGEV